MRALLVLAAAGAGFLAGWTACIVAAFVASKGELGVGRVAR